MGSKFTSTYLLKDTENLEINVIHLYQLILIRILFVYLLSVYKIY